MGFASWETCAAQLELHRARVTRRLPGSHVRAPRGGDCRRRPACQRHRRSVAVRRVSRCRNLPPRSPRADSPSRQPAAQLLLEFRGAADLRRLDAPGRARLDALLPRLLAAIAEMSRRRGAGSQLDVLRRVLKVLEAIGSRSAYFALLNENAQVRRKLVELAALGEFLAAQIASHPLLLDELLDESSGGLPPPRAELEREIGCAARAPGRGRARAPGGSAAPVPARGDFPRGHGRSHRKDSADARQRLSHRDRRDHRRAGHAARLGRR